ncbi:MAG: hypothetical protein IH994_02480 [Proteobacteria bacterium]|nr:hypothetical protein [Pseudomonadota bacterium]
MSINAGTSKLDVLLNEGAEVLRELKRFEDSRKLTFDAFYALALRIADCDKKRIAQVEKIIETKHGVEHIAAIVRRLSKEFSEARYVKPFPDPSKAVRIFGSTDLESQAAQHRILAGEVQALAVKACHERFGEEVFGVVENFDKHEAETKKLRTRLESIYSKMEGVASGADFVIDNSTLLPDERKRGLCRANFRRAPSISYGVPGWPKLLVEDCEAAVPIAEPKSNSIPRHRLNETASAVA